MAKEKLTPTDDGLSIQSITASWFEVGIRYDKTMEDGTQKKVTEQYTVDALSFSEAEARITEEMSAYISGDFKVVTEKVATYGEIFFSDKDADDKWYKVKVAFITIDEKTEKEKRSRVTYLVQANSTAKAEKYMHHVMGGTMIDYEVLSVSDTKIMDVFRHSYADKPGNKIPATVAKKMCEQLPEDAIEKVNLMDENEKSGLFFIGRTLAKPAKYEERRIVTLQAGSVIADIDMYQGLLHAGMAAKDLTVYLVKLPENMQGPDTDKEE